MDVKIDVKNVRPHPFGNSFCWANIDMHEWIPCVGSIWIINVLNACNNESIHIIDYNKYFSPFNNDK